MDDTHNLVEAVFVHWHLGNRVLGCQPHHFADGLVSFNCDNFGARDIDLAHDHLTKIDHG